MKRTYRYSAAAIARAYCRGAAGLSVTLLPLVILHPASWLAVVLWAGTALFLVYLARSIARHTTEIVLDERGIRTEGLFGASIPWGAVRRVGLDYYTTRNDRSQGWIELVVRGAGGVIRIESTFQGFSEIAACVAREALRRGCALDERTLTHLAVLGIRPAAQSGHAVDLLSGAHRA